MNLEKPNALHLLLAIIKNGEGYFSKIIQEKGLEYKALKKVVTSNNLSSNEEDNYIEPDNSNNDSLFKKESTNRGSKQDSKSVLDQFGYNVSKAAEEDKLDPVVGRDKEIERLAQILGRRKKNNPVLIGEPGVGKSAIVEGLAIKIAKREVSRALMNKRIISLDIGSIVAGTKYRGQFEERIKSILKEVSEDKNVILFIDEMHTLIGAGGAAGSLDAANMLKPALARGEIQCIGATTLDEYRQIIEKDGALDRRFQKVIVEPTDFAQTLEILEHIKGRYEIHHNVRYTNEALRACISMSQRYISDRCLPDKAIDIMDEAGSRVHLKNLNVPRKVAKLEKAIEQIKKELSDAVSNADYKNAAIFRDARDYKIKELEKAKSEWIAEQSKNPIIVGKEDIALVLSMATHIPVTKIAEAEGNKLINMGESLKKKIIGQDEAVEIVTKAIQRNRAGLKDPSKPIGTFLFLGPTGVGKTQLAKVLAEYLFDSPESLIRIDMSEYMEKYAVSRLIGAPPGYVGYNEGGQLSEKVRRHPYSVVLLDEIEKAHPDIFNILLQVLDEGRLTDSNGRNIDFRNTVVILTSNIGSKELKAFGAGMGYSNSVKRNYDATERQIIEKAVGKTFTPEFINRLDEQVIFNSLEKKDIEKIIDIELSALYERVEQAGYKISITAGAKKFVAKEGFDPLYGARPLKRSIQQYIEDPIAEAIISGKYKNGETITISINGGKNIILK
jgi:ATPases with chaperone activity, ATP-binding subunit